MKPYFYAVIFAPIINLLNATQIDIKRTTNSPTNTKQPKSTILLHKKSSLHDLVRGTFGAVLTLYP